MKVAALVLAFLVLIPVVAMGIPIIILIWTMAFKELRELKDFRKGNQSANASKPLTEKTEEGSAKS